MEAHSPAVDYESNFWGDKHHGFHVLYENMKRGEETVGEVAQFVKDRLVMEEEYAKALGKSVNRVASFINNGSCLDTGWSMTKGTLEILVDVQTMMVKNLQVLSREVVKYKEDVIKIRKDAKQQDVIDAVNLMQTTTTCLQKAKETYHSRCTELDKLRRETSPNPKELSKVESKLVKARDEYRGYIEKYETIRLDFEVKMEKACKLFQNHDRSHFAALQQFLVMYATHHQEIASSTQQLCGQLRESMQQLSVDDMLSRFVKERGTGVDRPQPAMFEDSECAVPDELLAPHSVQSGASSCSSSAVLQTSLSHPPTQTVNDLLSLDVLDAWTEKEPEQKTELAVQPSPTASHSSDSTAGPAPSSMFSASIGGTSTASGAAPQKKLSMFLPKRKKTISQSSTGGEETETGGGLFKFRHNRKSKKSSNDLTVSTERGDGFGMEDTLSTASSSRSEDKQTNGSMHPLDAPIGSSSRVDEEGFTIPNSHEEGREDTNWSSCSSDEEEDENDMQQSKIRSLTIRPAESIRTMNASVDELRDAIGHINIGRSSTFDKDPWSATLGGSKPPSFSQSLSGGSLKPLRPAHTADGRFRSNFSESEFSRSNVPLNFSASCGPVAGLARARPRSNTPTHNSSFAVNGQPHPSILNKDANGSQDWGSSFGMNRSDSHQSLGESSFNLSQSTANLMQATISEQHVPVAMAVNEYSHVWFKGADISQRSIRCFGTVMISFASSSLPLLTDVHSDMEALQFRLSDANTIKAVLPNKQLLLPASVAVQGPIYRYQFDRLGLANWLLAQQRERPAAAFYNAEVVRYELNDGVSGGEPPLVFTSYWKCEPEHTDVRIDYRLNPDSPITAPLLNLVFSTKVSGRVGSVTSDPLANWNAETSTLSWSVTELSRHGDCSGSLKARLILEADGPSAPAHSYALFQCSDSTLSGVALSLESSDTYHLSMVRRKVLAGKYFCEPEVRK